MIKEKNDHVKIAYDKLRVSEAYGKLAKELRELASQNYGDNGFPNRFPVSGGICKHWPAGTKAEIVNARRKGDRHLNGSLESWKRAGKRHVTWLKVKDGRQY